MALPQKLTCEILVHYLDELEIDIVHIDIVDRGAMRPPPPSKKKQNIRTQNFIE